ncbi:hypothetical protein Psi02_63260 [Planotetraspora silvatica]|uniref:Uncharacterized protein n=1 Tax=Planotetraspora silvatica TaxID=234614 RepID=A0A8J3UU81_9ACTN|nr:hypothetical protein [Planotetraspora silvatica]GII49902.1 hypothetical protein Psi02_63260 [Planotetraspora silvatica]
MKDASAPLHQPRRKGRFLFVRNVLVIVLPLIVVGALMSGVQAGDQQAAEQICAQHHMVVRTLDYPPKQAQATGVICTPSGRWDDRHVYPLSQSGLSGLLGGFLIPFVCLVYVALGCATFTVWTMIARFLRGRSAR